MRILVTGSNGMLGEAIEKIFKGYNLVLTDLPEFDVRIPKRFHKLPPSPDYIIHLAAETDLEFCETYPKYAFHTNTIGTFNMVELAKQLDIPIVYMSTAGVFGRHSAPHYTEDTPPCPINMYGLSKYYGEIAVKAYPKHWIFRISWAFGGKSRDRKFVWKIIQQISSFKKDLYVIDDKSGSPSYTKDIATVIYNFIKEEKPYGTYHIPTGVATRYDVAKEIIKGLDTWYPEIHKVSSQKFVTYTTTRPKCEVLKSIKGVEVRDWREALKEYLDEITKSKIH